MANARQGAFGSISGLLRTVQNIGLVGSYVLAISVAAALVHRQVAFEVFIGTSNLSGGVSNAFLGGTHNAFYASIAILIIAVGCRILGEKKYEKKNHQILKPNIPNLMMCISAKLAAGEMTWVN